MRQTRILVCRSCEGKDIGTEKNEYGTAIVKCRGCGNWAYEYGEGKFKVIRTTEPAIETGSEIKPAYQAGRQERGKDMPVPEKRQCNIEGCKKYRVKDGFCVKHHKEAVIKGLIPDPAKKVRRKKRKQPDIGESETLQKDIISVLRAKKSTLKFFLTDGSRAADIHFSFQDDGELIFKKCELNVFPAGETLDFLNFQDWIFLGSIAAEIQRIQNEVRV